MDDEEKKPDITQIPLIGDAIFDRKSLPKASRTPRARQKIQPSYSPDYDPETIDLFGIDIEMPNAKDNETVAAELRDAADQFEDLVHTFATQIDVALRVELTDQLTSILKDLASIETGSIETGSIETGSIETDAIDTNEPR